MKIRTCAARVAALLMACAALTVSAQKRGETTVLNRGGLHGNGLVALSTGGAITSIVNFPSVNPTGITDHEDGGPDLIIDGRSIYQMKNRVYSVITTVLFQAAWDIDVADDTTYVLAAGDKVITYHRPTKVQTTLAAGFGDVRQVAWNGDDGSMIVIDSTNDAVISVARDGTRRSVATVPNARCATWDSWSGDMFVAAAGALYRVTSTGSIATLSTGTPGLTEPVGMVLRVDRTLIVVQGGNGVNGVYAYDGATGRYLRKYQEAMTPAAGVSPADVMIEHSRDCWPRSAARVGQTLDIRVNFPAYRGRPFMAALSFGYKPGFQAGNRFVHLVQDDLFFLSLLNKNFFNGVGTLDSSGVGAARLNIPAIQGLRGTRIYAAAIVPDRNVSGGVAIASYATGFTIQ